MKKVHNVYKFDGGQSIHDVQWTALLSNEQVCSSFNYNPLSSSNKLNEVFFPQPGKTRFLVTHSITYLPLTDHIIVMKDGEVSEQGSYQELVDRKGAFATFLQEHMTEEDDNDDDDDGEEKKRDLLQKQISVLSKQSSHHGAEKEDGE